MENKLKGMPRKIYGVRGSRNEINSPSENPEIEFNEALEKDPTFSQNSVRTKETSTLTSSHLENDQFMLDGIISTPKQIPSRRTTKQEDPLKYDKRRNLSQGDRIAPFGFRSRKHSETSPIFACTPPGTTLSSKGSRSTTASSYIPGNLPQRNQNRKERRFEATEELQQSQIVTVSGEGDKVYEKVTMISESQTFAEINRILEFVYKPALDGIDEINKVFVAHTPEQTSQTSFKHLESKKFNESERNLTLPHNDGDLAVTALIIGFNQIVDQRGSHCLLQKILGSLFDNITKLRIKIFKRLAYRVYKSTIEDYKENRANYFYKEDGKLKMTEEYVRKHKIYKKLETIIAEHWPRICSSQNTLSRNVLTSPKKKSLNIHSILLEVLQIAGNQVKLLDADQMVRFLQTLRGTIRKIEHQTSILEQCWASYFNAYPYRQQLRRYADLDHQVMVGLPGYFLQSFIQIQSEKSRYFLSNIPFDIWPDLSQILQSSAHHMALIDRLIVDDKVINGFIENLASVKTRQHHDAQFQILRDIALNQGIANFDLMRQNIRARIKQETSLSMFELISDILLEKLTLIHKTLLGKDRSYKRPDNIGDLIDQLEKLCDSHPENLEYLATFIEYLRIEAERDEENKKKVEDDESPPLERTNLDEEYERVQTEKEAKFNLNEMGPEEWANFIDNFEKEEKGIKKGRPAVTGKVNGGGKKKKKKTQKKKEKAKTVLKEKQTHQNHEKLQSKSQPELKSKKTDPTYPILLKPKDKSQRQPKDKTEVMQKNLTTLDEEDSEEEEETSEDVLETSTDKKVANLKKKLKESRMKPRRVIVPFLSNDWLKELRMQTMKLNKQYGHQLMTEKYT